MVLKMVRLDLTPWTSLLELHYEVSDVKFSWVAATLISNFTSRYPQADWAQEGGDPCLPVPSSWVQCNSDPQPKIVSMYFNRNSRVSFVLFELTLCAFLKCYIQFFIGKIYIFLNSQANTCIYGLWICACGPWFC